MAGEDKTIKFRTEFDTSAIAKGGADIDRMFETMFSKASEKFATSGSIIKAIRKQLDGADKEIEKWADKELKSLNLEFNSKREDSLRRGHGYKLNKEDYSEFSGRRKEISDELNSGKSTNDLLRELITVTQTNANKEIQSDKKTVENILKEKPLEQMTPKERVQHDLLKRESTRHGGGGAGHLALSSGETLLESKDPTQAGLGLVSNAGGMIAGLAGGVIIGGAIALGAKAAEEVFNKFQEYQKNNLAGSAVTGGNYEGSRIGGSVSEFGYSKIQFAERLAPSARNRRSGVGLEESIREGMMLERAAGIDQGTYNQMEQLSVVGGSTGMENIQSAISAMRSSGIVKGDDMSAVPDYLSIIASTSKEQLSRLGKIDIGMNTKMVTALASMDDNLKKSPEALSTMLNAVKGGLSSSKSTQTEALQYSVLSKIAPGADMFELQKMKENPLDSKYLPKYLETLKGMSGGNQHQFYQQIMQQFGLSASMAETLGKGYDDGSLKKSLSKKIKGEIGIEGVEEKASKNTSSKEKEVAGWENGVVAFGEGVKILAETLSRVTREQNEIADKMIKSNELTVKASGILLNASKYHAFNR